MWFHARPPETEISVSCPKRRRKSIFLVSCPIIFIMSGFKKNENFKGLLCGAPRPACLPASGPEQQTQILIVLAWASPNPVPGRPAAAPSRRHRRPVLGRAAHRNWLFTAERGQRNRRGALRSGAGSAGGVADPRPACSAAAPPPPPPPPPLVSLLRSAGKSAHYCGARANCRAAPRAGRRGRVGGWRI